MNTQARIFISGLLVAVVGLGVALGVVLATDGSDDGDRTTNGMMNSNDGFAGMMGAMGSMDSDAMLSHMRDALGEEQYQRMLGHFRDHKNGAPMTGDPEIDDMMHRMMDGMMQHMPADSDNIFPPGNDQHHETPGPRMTP